MYFYFGRGAKDCNERACVSNVSAHISQRPHVQTSKFTVHVNCGRGSNSDDDAMRYLLPVLWMTSCFAHSRPGKRDANTRMLKVSHQGQNRGRSVMPVVYT